MVINSNGNIYISCYSRWMILWSRILVHFGKKRNRSKSFQNHESISNEIDLYNFELFLKIFIYIQITKAKSAPKDIFWLNRTVSTRSYDYIAYRWWFESKSILKLTNLEMNLVTDFFLQMTSLLMAQYFYLDPKIGSSTFWSGFRLKVFWSNISTFSSKIKRHIMYMQRRTFPRFIHETSY